MTLKAQRAALIKEAQGIAAQADLTDDNIARLEQIEAEVKAFTEQIERAEKGDRLIAALNGFDAGDVQDDRPAKSIGEHFAKHVGRDGFNTLKSRRGFTADAPEFDYKAATDPNLTGGPSGSYADWLVDVDKTIVHPFRQQPIVADLLGSGTISGTAIKYYVELANPTEGAFATVAEGAQKPQMHSLAPTPRTDALTKIAGWWDTSDEMVEDLPFMVSEINNRGLYLLSMAEEAQLLNGDGTGTNLLGLLNRSGIQTETQGVAPDTAEDTIFRAIMKVQTATGLAADGIMINPADYQALRLKRDANNQYYGGGYFQGEYGNGGMAWQPPLWGLRTIVTAAVPAKTVVVGAFKAAATVYRKGGIRVESTNSDLGKFTTNIITTRMEERIALACRIPQAIVKTTLT